MTIGRRIQMLRQKQMLTQKELAEKAKIPLITLQQYERGVRKNPNPESLEKIAHALHVSTANLLAYKSDEGFWTNRFRLGLHTELIEKYPNATDLRDDSFDLSGALDIAKGNVGFSFEDACQLADELGTSIDLLTDWCGAHEKNAESYKQSLVADDTVDLTLMALLIQKKQNCPIEEAEKKAEIISSCIQTKELSDELLQLNLAPKELQDIIRAALKQSKNGS